MITLRTGRLQVQVAGPEELGTQVRFDHGAFVKQVILDGRVRFCGAEPLGPNGDTSGGCGLCCEFLLDREAPAAGGTRIPKLGVGIVTRGPGTGGRGWGGSLFAAAPVSAEQTADTVQFTTQPLPCGGCAARIRRSLSARGKTLTLTTQLENTGEDAIGFQEYCHNFISLNGMALNGAYALELPDVREPGLGIQDSPRGREAFSAEHGRVRPDGDLTHPAGFRLERSRFTRQDRFSWRIVHEGARACVTGSTDFLPEAVSVWAKGNVLCPELFCRAVVPPGGSHRWQRRWVFDMLSEEGSI